MMCEAISQFDTGLGILVFFARSPGKQMAETDGGKRKGVHKE